MGPLLAVVILACRPDGDDTGGVVPGDFPLEVTLSEVVPTVATASWSLDGEAPTRAWVRAGRTAPDELQVAVDLAAGPPWSTPLIGLTPETGYLLEVEVEAAGGTLRSDRVAITTGPERAGVSDMTIEDLDPSARHGGFLVTAQVALPAVALVLDRDGSPVWAYAPSGVEMMGRVQLSADRRRVLMGEVNLEADEDSEIVAVGLDGTEEERIPLPYRHHDFVELADGTIGYLAYDPRNLDGDLVAGDRIMERRPDGTLVEVYNIWDHRSPDGWSGNGPVQTWPHANALEYDPVEDDWLVSFLLLNAIVRVDRGTGAETWVLGGEDSTLTTSTGGTAYFQGQHGMHLLDGSMLVFVNGVSNEADSRVVEISVDPAQARAETVWSWQPEPGLACPVFGDVERFEDGNTLVTFSYNGVVHELDAADQPLWTLSTGIGGTLSYLSWMETLQAPD